MNILLPTDAFPPVCGGSGWSTYELARGLRGRGHTVIVVQPRPGTPRGVRETTYEGCGSSSSAPRRRRFLTYATTSRTSGCTRSWRTFLADLIARERIDLVHGQHVMTSVPSVDAAQAAAIPAVCTVRDYWPVCYWSDLIHTSEGLALCPQCSAAMMTQCVRPHANGAVAAALPMIPYMRANLRAQAARASRAPTPSSP